MPVPVPHQRTAVLPQQADAVSHACADAARAAGAPAEGGAAARGVSAWETVDRGASAQQAADPAGSATAEPAIALVQYGVGMGSQEQPEPQGANQSFSADHGPHDQGLTLLLIGEDPNSPVPEMWDWSGRKVRLRTARNLTEAERLLTDDVQCILLDLAPPEREERDAGGEGCPGDELDMLREVLRMAPAQAVLVLTSETDAERAADAVRVGAQDYLFRGELDGAVLSRAVRYAVERKRADLAQRQLTESRMLAQENARLERGLLPTPLLDGSDLRFAACYRPGRSRALLGGDFYDTVRTPDGTVHAMIGDVCGHGPDEAALGVELRIAWRALTFAGLCGDELLSTLQKVLEHERADDEIFATLCTVDVSADGRRAGLCLAGHPAPLLARAGRTPQLLPYEFGGPALGLLPHARWPRRQVELGGSWSLMMYTDGLIEGRIGEGNQRLGQEGMTELVSRQMASGLRGEELLNASVREVRDLNGGELTDDVAVLLLDRR
ncbi:SpoIIE family protein phosphatase [Streptomyces sp. NPDC050636]|uniref:PP2C family protein-serine/threonine phosphatase n=1 Tax=Streptomyces sp. NPDC050636 TaxID=3154510 RepID=UPI00343BE4AD